MLQTENLALINLSRKLILALIFSFFGVAPSTAKLSFQAMTSSGDDTFILIEGDFTLEDSIAEFQKLARNSGAEFVIFDSTGGSPFKAVELGRAIRRLGLSTLQPRALECSSACALAFMGGVNRYAEPGAIGVHKISFAEEDRLETSEAVSTVQNVTADIVTYMIEMGVKPDLLKLLLKTDANDMRYLSGREMQDFNLIHRNKGDRLDFDTAAVPEPPSSRTHRHSATQLPRKVPNESARETSQGRQLAIFYEEGSDPGSAGTVAKGDVTWSLAEEDDLSGKKQSVLIADVDVPEKSISFRIRFKPNDDAKLQASHLVEIKFDLPHTYPFGAIVNVPGLVMKDTEEALGDALIGASVSVKPDLYWIALSNLPQERAKNINLLKGRGWIDLPVVFENGKRGIFTLEKGSKGFSAIEKAIADWTSGSPANLPPPRHSRIR